MNQNVTVTGCLRAMQLGITKLCQRCTASWSPPRLIYPLPCVSRKTTTTTARGRSIKVGYAKARGPDRPSTSSTFACRVR